MLYCTDAVSEIAYKKDNVCDTFLVANDALFNCVFYSMHPLSRRAVKGVMTF